VSVASQNAQCERRVSCVTPSESARPPNTRGYGSKWLERVLVTLRCWFNLRRTPRCDAAGRPALRVLGRRGGELRPSQPRINSKAFADRGGVRDGRAIDEDFRQLAAPYVSRGSSNDRLWHGPSAMSAVRSLSGAKRTLANDVRTVRRRVCESARGLEFWLSGPFILG
jgi:hypothetical protein